MESSEDQEKIIQDKNNIVVVARPGSGKTYTIVEKIKLILKDSYNYQGIIAISFTNKASEELRNRCINSELSLKSSFFGTIDKFCFSQIIVPFCSHLSSKIQELKIQELKNFDDLKNFNKNNDKEVKKIIEEYLKQDIVFLELLGETAIYILKNVPDAIKYLRARYKEIFIDEYQDCGSSQHELFLYLVNHGIKGMAVGDIHQAIYGFAEKFPKYLKDLTQNHDFSHYRLLENFRCHPSIYQYALRLFGPVEEYEKEKRVFRVKITGDERSIAKEIEKIIPFIKEKYNLRTAGKFAILCRSNTTVGILNQSLTIPHKVYKNTELDKDNSEFARLFIYLLRGYFDKNIYAIDIAERFFSKEYERNKYRSLLNATQQLFACPVNKLIDDITIFSDIANIIYPNVTTKDISETLTKLKNVLSDKCSYENYIPTKDNELSIMTIHKSKGLEFDVIFQMDMYKYVFPSKNSYEQDLNLHYVAITRAKVACFLMEGTIRHNSRMESKLANPSEFYNLPGLATRRHDIDIRTKNLQPPF